MKKYEIEYEVEGSHETKYLTLDPNKISDWEYVQKELEIQEGEHDPVKIWSIHEVEIRKVIGGYDYKLVSRK